MYQFQFLLFNKIVIYNLYRTQYFIFIFFYIILLLNVKTKICFFVNNSILNRPISDASTHYGCGKNKYHEGLTSRCCGMCVLEYSTREKGSMSGLRTMQAGACNHSNLSG